MVEKASFERLMVIGAIFDPKQPLNDPKSRPSQVSEPSGRQKSRRSGLFILFVPLVSFRLVVLVVPGGRTQFSVGK